ncbi:MAG: hypothetical protein ACYC2O_13765, partial [Microthrixaceae bacterium]
RWASIQIAEAFLVRSTTPAGSYDPTVIGTRLPAGLPFGNVDWPRDGSLDLTMRVGAVGGAFTGSTTIVDGAAVLAAGPGGDASGAVLASIGGVPIGVLGYPTGDLLATLEAGEAGIGLVRVADRAGTTELTTVPPGASLDQSTLVAASVSEQRRFVRVSSDNRSGYRAWLWALDDPCAPVAAAAAPATRAPAPREAGLRFTG